MLAQRGETRRTVVGVGTLDAAARFVGIALGGPGASTAPRIGDGVGVASVLTSAAAAVVLAAVSATWLAIEIHRARRPARPSDDARQVPDP